MSDTFGNPLLWRGGFLGDLVLVSQWSFPTALAGLHTVLPTYEFGRPFLDPGVIAPVSYLGGVPLPK